MRQPQWLAFALHLAAPHTQSAFPSAEAQKRKGGNELCLHNLLRTDVLGKFVSAPPRTPPLPGNELADRLAGALRTAPMRPLMSCMERNSLQFCPEVAHSLLRVAFFLPLALQVSCEEKMSSSQPTVQHG